MADTGMEQRNLWKTYVRCTQCTLRQWERNYGKGKGMDRCGSWKNVLKLSTGHLACYWSCVYLCARSVRVCVRMFCTVNKNPKWFKIGYKSFAYSYGTFVYTCGSLVKVRAQNTDKKNKHKNFEISFFGRHPMKSVCKYLPIQFIASRQRDTHTFALSSILSVCQCTQEIRFSIAVFQSLYLFFALVLYCHHFCFRPKDSFLGLSLSDEMWSDSVGQWFSNNVYLVSILKLGNEKYMTSSQPKTREILSSYFTKLCLSFN